MVKIDVINAQLPQECLELVARVYQHPNSNKFTRDFIRFEMQRILGTDYDIKTYLNNPKYKMSK